MILSTIHSSKGLEYDTVYLLDVFDGLLPTVTEPQSVEEQKQYQEERRLFYVAMTRARNHLFLFSCCDWNSAFLGELQRELPVEVPESDDIFGALPRELCGKHYHHAQKGRGTIVASCDGRCMIAYPGGETQLLSVGQMYEQRMILRKTPEAPAAARKKRAATLRSDKRSGQQSKKTALSPEEKAALTKEAVCGRKVIHTTFGEGKIVGHKATVVTIRFSKHGEKKFILLDAIERGQLRFAGGQ